MRIKETIVVLSLIFSSAIIMAKGFDGAQAPGGAQTNGAPMADQDNNLGWKEGKPVSTSVAVPSTVPNSVPNSVPNTGKKLNKNK